MFTDIRSSCCQGQFYSLRHGGDQQLMLYYSFIKHTGDKNNLEFITKNEEILILSNSLSNYMYHHRYERTVKKHDCGYWAACHMSLPLLAKRFSFDNNNIISCSLKFKIDGFSQDLLVGMPFQFHSFWNKLLKISAFAEKIFVCKIKEHNYIALDFSDSCDRPKSTVKFP